MLSASGRVARATSPLLLGLPVLVAVVGCSTGSLELSVAANPNNVLSAAATVSWTNMKVSSLSITAQASGGAAQSSPTVTVSGLSSPVVIPVLPLKARTTYTIHASGKSSTGEALLSKDVSFTTGALPPPVTGFTVAAGGTPSPGYTLVDPQPLPGTDPPQYLQIVDGTGAAVWYYASTPICGGDFQQQPDGSFTIAVNDPTHVITGLSEAITVYRQIDALGNELHTWSALDVPDATPPIVIAGTDGHDIRIQPNGDALLLGLNTKTIDMSSYGGKTDANVVGNVLERVTAAGVVTFSWDAFKYLDVANIDPAAASVTGGVVDFSHGNAIDVMDDGNYLVSMRDLSQVLKIDATTGAILWKLGGKDGQFKFVDDSLNGFSCQHGGRELANGDILLLDDGDGHSPPQSRAVEYKLDTTAMTATLVWSSEDTPPLYSLILGFAQRLTSGNTLITYGTALQVQEVDQTGKVVWNLTDPSEEDFGIYRAFRLDALSPWALTGG